MQQQDRVIPARARECPKQVRGGGGHGEGRGVCVCVIIQHLERFGEEEICPESCRAVLLEQSRERAFLAQGAVCKAAEVRAGEGAGDLGTRPLSAR